MNSIWALDDLTLTNGSPRLVPGTQLDQRAPADVMPDPEEPRPDEVMWSSSTPISGMAALKIAQEIDAGYFTLITPTETIRSNRISSTGSNLPPETD